MMQSNQIKDNFQNLKKYMNLIGHQHPSQIVLTAAMTNINQLMMKCVQSLGNGSEPPLAKGVGVQHCSVRWSMLIEHASNQLLQMLLLISHNANLHVACGYIGC